MLVNILAAVLGVVFILLMGVALLSAIAAATQMPQQLQIRKMVIVAILGILAAFSSVVALGSFAFSTFGFYGLVEPCDPDEVFLGDCGRDLAEDIFLYSLVIGVTTAVGAWFLWSALYGRVRDRTKRDSN